MRGRGGRAEGPPATLSRRIATAGRVAGIVVAVTVVSVPGAGAGSLAGQSTEPSDGAAVDRAALSGEVLDAASGEPLAEARLTLRPLADSEGWPGARPAWSERRALTDALGRYRFDDLVAGPYALEVDRLGFRGAKVRVEIRAVRESRVAVGLELDPIVLEPVSVVGPPPAPYDRDLSIDAAGSGQVPATELRQRRYLASDVWSLSHAELLGAVTLGESDLFRALQRLPGVSTRDEWTAELWTRGSDWDHTRVYFDGLPLFNPLHGGGVLSGVSSDAVGAVYLHPGVRPARLGEGGTVLELRSRPAGGVGDVRGFGELSLASARVAADQRVADGRGGWMVAARRTYLDWLSSGIGKAFDIEDAAIPFRFTDVTARLDYPLPGDAALEVSALWEEDRLTGDVPDVVHGSRVAWGNLGVQATVSADLGAVRARHTLGFTGYGVDVDSIPEGPSRFNEGPLGEIHHDIRYWMARGELSPRRAGGAWSVGYDVVHQGARADGETPAMYLHYRTTEEDTLSMRDDLTTVGAWVDRRWELRALEVDAGLRAEAGTAVENGGGVRLSPSVLARVRVAEGLTMTAAAGRSWQYTQMLTPIGHFRPDFPSGHLWLLAGDEVPALRSDVLSLGGELWIAGEWLVSATGYLRASDGVVIPDPRPGITLGRPLFVAVEERGRGLELGLRRLKGRVTGSAAYTLGSAEQRLDDLVFPTRADRRHLVDVTALARLGGGVRLGAAYTYATGSPYTRVTHFGETEEGERVGVLGRPNEHRMRSYASLDVMVDWMKRFDRWGVGAYLQLRNALDRENTANYESTTIFCPHGAEPTGPDRTECRDGSTPRAFDQFLFGLPRFPLLGFRLEF